MLSLAMCSSPLGIARPLAFSPSALPPPPRALLEDRRMLSAYFNPRTLLINAMLHPALSFTEHLSRILPKQDVDDPSSPSNLEFERSMQALFAPFEKEAPGLTSDSPWPAILKLGAYNFGVDICTNLMVWGLEEVAIGYFTDKVCDDLTKNVQKSTCRKLERGEPRLAAAADMVPTAIKAKALQYFAWFTFRSAETVFRRAKAWWQRSKTPAAPSLKTSAHDEVASFQSTVVTGSWFPEILLLARRYTGRCVVDGLVCGVITIILPVGFLSEYKTRHLWSALNVSGCAAANTLFGI